jgi:hypothetical protein
MTTQQRSTSTFNIEERHADNLADFLDCLTKSRFWYLLPQREHEVEKAQAILDAQTGLRYPCEATLRAFLDQNPFVYLQNFDGEQNLATLQSSKQMLWSHATSDKSYPFEEGQQVLKKGRWAGLDGWRLPGKDELKAFATAKENPHRAGQAYRMNTVNAETTYQWLTQEGYCDTDNGCWNTGSNSLGYIFACHTLWADAPLSKVMASLASHGWKLVAPSGQTFGPDRGWQAMPAERLLANLVLENQKLHALGYDKLIFNPRNHWVDFQLTDIDHTPCRLPKLDSTQLTDPDKGIWELWGESAESLNRFAQVARDPGQDVQRRAVAIDFGTSSTVVAMDTSSGGRELLRIGVRDFYQSVQPQHFENPTVLECLDYSSFEQAWTERAYRPSLDWKWMRAAHEAQASFRDNPGETGILASILPRLKQWALRSNEHRRMRMTDRQGHELELAPHAEHNPVRGQSLSVSADYPFDPIELYAWYLGMTINWRGRGIFLKYYMSFPVKYPRHVKERILASFRRGLQRSLPGTLIEHHPQVLNEFEVNDLASEPAAYAAAAMPHLGIQPNEEGVPYAVFDFGGGTSDFDYGLLRWATEQEEYEGYEQVFEHLASSGDNFLGGENLLEHLVYQCLRDNLDVLRNERIQFTKPMDAQPFAGSEAFLAATQAAQTNTVMLAAKLRPLLESDSCALVSQLKLDLINADGNKKTCELGMAVEALDDLLASRVRLGVEAFLAELARIKDAFPAGATIHVLLAGNGSRSRHVRRLFDTDNQHWAELLEQAFGGNPPDIVVHQPLQMDTENPHAPTTKTGVALGLLRLVPGKNTLLLDHVQERHEGQAPFAWFVGRLRRGSFAAIVSPSATYGEWQELGALQQGVFNLYASNSPRSHLGIAEGDPELKMYRLDFPAAAFGSRLFARATAPNAIELAPAKSIEEIDKFTISPMVLE